MKSTSSKSEKKAKSEKKNESITTKVTTQTITKVKKIDAKKKVGEILSKPEKKYKATTTSKIKKSEGGKTIQEFVTTYNKSNKIKVTEDVVIQSYTKDVEEDDEGKIYINALKYKKELAIMIGDSHVDICSISLSSADKIFRLFGESLEESFDLISYGIYSEQEIYKMTKNIIKKEKIISKTKDESNLDEKYEKKYILEPISSESNKTKITEKSEKTEKDINKTETETSKQKTTEITENEYDKKYELIPDINKSKEESKKNYEKTYELIQDDSQKIEEKSATSIGREWCVSL